MINLARIILAIMLLAPVMNPVADAALMRVQAPESACCCQAAMAAMENPALPCNCAGRASCRLMQDNPAGLAVFLPSSPLRLSLDLSAGPLQAVCIAAPAEVMLVGPSRAKPPPGPLFLLNHVLLI